MVKNQVGPACGVRACGVRACGVRAYRDPGLSGSRSGPVGFVPAGSVRRQRQALSDV